VDLLQGRGHFQKDLQELLGGQFVAADFVEERDGPELQQQAPYFSLVAGINAGPDELNGPFGRPLF
jgi:hypothetical protein